MKKKLTLISLITFIFIVILFQSCSEKENPVQPIENKSNIILASNTKELQIDAYLTSIIIDSQRVILEYNSNNNIPAFKVGDIVLSKYNGGFLRKINSITSNGNTITLFTSNASMDEAFSKIFIDTSFTFSPTLPKLESINYNELIKTETSSYEVKVQSGNPVAKINSVTGAINLQFPNLIFRIIKPDQSRFELTADNVSIGIDISVIKNVMDVGFLDVKQFSLIYRVETTQQFNNVQMLFKGGLDEQSPDLLHEDLIPNDIFLGSAAFGPIIMTFYFNLAAGIQGRFLMGAGTNLVSNMTSVSSYDVGAEFINGSWTQVWNKTTQGTTDINFTPTASLTGDAKFFLKPKLKAKIFDILGPTLFVRGFLYGEFTYPPIHLGVGLGVDGGLGFDIKFLTFRIASLQAVLAEKKWPFWQYTYNVPAAPTLSSPSNGAMLPTSQPNLVWNSSANANNYTLQVSHENDFTNFIFNESVGNTLSKQINGLSSGTLYYWRVNALNNDGPSAWSAVWNFTTTNLPAVPSSLVAQSVSSNEVALTWHDNASNETGFKIEKRLGTGGTWQQSGQTSTNDTDFVVTGLTQMNDYYFRVYAYNANGNSGYSNIVSISTPEPDIPNPPTLLASPQQTSTSISLTWQDNSGKESGFRISRKDLINTSWTQIAEEPANTVSYTNNGLSSNTTYSYRVTAFNSNGVSAPSNTLTTKTQDNVPPSPSNLAITYNSPGILQLSWNDNSSNETGFRLYKSSISEPQFDPIELSANTQQYVDQNITDGYTYHYYVVAYNLVGESNPSNSVSGTYLPAPTGLEAYTNSNTVIDLYWNQSSYHEKYIRIQNKISSNPNWGGGYARVDANYGQLYSYSVSNLNPGTSYDFRIARENESGYVSSYSNVATAVTSSIQATIQGIVTNSQDGSPISGVSITSDDGSNTITNSDGTYSINVNLGNRTITASKSGFISLPRTINVSAGGTYYLNFTLSPILQNAVNRIVLTWGENPHDLDLHMKTPTIEGNEYHIYYASLGNSTSPPYAYLDHDDTTSYGPETITITQLFPGTYRVFIHNFTDREIPNSTTLASSSAVIDLYNIQGLIQTIHIPASGSGRYWNVCTINGSTGQITVINQIIDTEPIANKVIFYPPKRK